MVAPLVGAWIEIQGQRLLKNVEVVAPLVGAWIEIKGGRGSIKSNLSLLL